jgi:hypothetical protein
MGFTWGFGSPKREHGAGVLIELRQNPMEVDKIPPSGFDS